MVMSNHREKVEQRHKHNDEKDQYNNTNHLHIFELVHVHVVVKHHNDYKKRVENSADHALFIIFLIALKVHFDDAQIRFTHYPLPGNRE
ncbi:hypothetical protein D3C73_883560 [compost metagenome]